MSAAQLALLGLLFLIVFALALLVLRLLTGSAVQERLQALGDGGAASDGGRHARRRWLVHAVSLTRPLARLSLPDEGWESSPIRSRFVHAGWRSQAAPALFYAAKTGLFVGLPLLAYFLLRQGGHNMLLWLVAAAALGYYLPNAWLSHCLKQRQREVFETFPDALDLMTVCVEAGLAMDAALARVAQEIGLKSAVLAEELQLVTLELRAGSAKDKALRNLALRTGVDDVDALVTLLIQAERFGTSIAASLRVQSDQLRTKRRQRAEETAARIALKLLFPLIFFIFPSLMVVLMGPAFLQIYRVLLPAMRGS
ncbi:type II secretion system F family protein [Janthinobacterium lividum]|uniref:type II secretion system F family protein n=1 Tax=Janthinobacterium lividum TaxID=29581 RepID=UPI000873B0C1|nr:type II secretion system F family protein [Janthinobacterium lividum]MCC7717248.1 type II secretion system F family protein [Janthinobacterium lividum]WQE31596.1 type II secretion system F family protein [Janthinobacterium lividum]